MTHPSDPGLPRPVVNIPDKPVLSDLYQDHLASLEHAHSDKPTEIVAAAASPLSSSAAITSLPVPIELAMRQGATGVSGEGTLVSSGWRNGR